MITEREDDTTPAEAGGNAGPWRGRRVEVMQRKGDRDTDRTAAPVGSRPETTLHWDGCKEVCVSGPRGGA